MSVDEYRTRFGLPWSRGLTSAASVASSGRTDERKAKARKLARINRFFENYRNHVVGGEGHVLIESIGFDNFKQAILQKLLLEIG